MRFQFWVLIIILMSCGQKQSSEAITTSDTTSNEVVPEDAFEKEDQLQIDYKRFFGVYDHESSTTGFSAVLALRQNGNDMYFNISVAQGSCKGETEGVVVIIEQTEAYLSGFYEADNCRLQFTFQRTENKVDVKEITLCQLLGGGCSYEGTYVKRKN
jgi:hypothetical protein